MYIHIYCKQLHSLMLHCIVISHYHIVYRGSDRGMRYELIIVSIHVTLKANCMVRRFNHGGLRQVQDCFITDKDLHGQKILPCN